MAYANETPIYLLPSIGAGEFISEADEERFANIIENQLIGSISAHSGGHGVFRVGNFSSVDNGGGNFDINLSPDGGTPAADGFIHLIYFRSTSTITWSISGDGTHSLYLRLVENKQFSSREFGDIVPESSTDGTIPDDAILVAEATISGGVLTVLNEDPSDKLSISTIIQHIAQNINPHSTLLEQDQMVISGLTVETIKSKAIEFTDSLVVSGLSQFGGEVQLNNNLNIQGDLVVSGNSLFLGPVKMSGIALFTKAVFSELDVTSGADFRSRIRFFEDIEIDSGITIDGRNIGQDGLVLDDHVSGVSAFRNPHKVTAAQVSGIPHSGSENSGPILQGNLNLLSGISIDGIDPSVLKFLIDGSNADVGGDGVGHTHLMSGVQEQFITYSPEYPNSVLSGIGTVIVSSEFIEPNTFYKTTPEAQNKQSFAAISRIGVPADFKKWVDSGITLVNGVDDLTEADNFVKVTLRDTSNSPIKLDNNILRNSLPTTTTLITSGLNGGTFDNGKIFTAIIEMGSFSGVGVNGQKAAYAGDLTFKYETVFKS